MKKILLLMMMAFSISVFSQQQQQQQQQQQRFYLDNKESKEVYEKNITHNQIMNGWAQIGTRCVGCVSIFYKITQRTHENMFLYTIYFFSNSYGNDGIPTATYLDNITVKTNGITVWTADYFLVKEKKSNTLVEISSISPSAVVEFFYEDSKIY